MARLRSKPDFTAGFITWIDGKPVRALELRVKSDDLYAMQPRRGNAEKVSYHASGQFHIKVGRSKPILATTELPPRFVKEYRYRLARSERRLFSVSLENGASLLPFTGQEYDRQISLHVPRVDGLAVIELYLGSDSGQPGVYEEEGYLETTVTERSFEGANYQFCIRLAVLTDNGGYQRPYDELISRAWLDAAETLGIHVKAPFALPTYGGDSLLYEAYLPNFGGEHGIVLGIAGRDDGDLRSKRGYSSSDLSDAYRVFDRTLFADALNCWGWFGADKDKPEWASTAGRIQPSP